MKKRVLSLFMALMLCLTLLPTAALAEETNVAEVTINGTTTQYTDIEAAFTAAQGAASATVKLLTDVTIPKDDRDYSYGIKLTGGNITLDLNGCTIQTTGGTSGFAPRDAVFYIEGGKSSHSSLTVQDKSTNGGGKIVQPNGGQAINVGSNSTLTVKSGVTIEVTSSDESNPTAVIMDKNCAVFLTGSGTANILDGTLTGKQGIYVKNGTLSVSGGTIHGKNSYALWVAGGSAALSGGSYTTDVTDGCSIWNAADTAGNLLASGYRFESKGSESKYSDDTHGVVGDTTVAVRPVGEFSYIGADGTEQTHAGCTELTEAGFEGALAGNETWFAAKEDVTANGPLQVCGTVNLILCDGVTVTLNEGIALNGQYTQPATLNIYAQSGGTGTLICSGPSDSGYAGIYDNSTGNETALNIYGGVITATGTSYSLYSGLFGAGIGSIGNYKYKSTMTVNISGGTVTTKSGGPGAAAIGRGAKDTSSTVTVTIAPGMKCVKTDDPNTAYDPGNTDGTSVTVTKCENHVWEYTYTEDSSTHTKTCKLCNADGGSDAHKAEKYVSVSETQHNIYCVCGKTIATKSHDMQYTPNADGLTHKTSCKHCGWTSADEKHTFGETGACVVCGIEKSAEYNGTVYASLQAAVNAAAASGGTVTLARDVSENVTVTGGTLTVDLNGKTWHVYEDVNSNIIQKTPLTVTGGSVTLENGTIIQGVANNGNCGVRITGGSVTVKGTAVVIGSNKDGGALLPPAPAIELENGNLTLETGATLVYGLKVPEGKHLSDYLPEGTAFRLRSYNEGNGTLTEDNGLLNAYTINNYAEHDMALVVVEHKHTFAAGTTNCECGFTCAQHDWSKKNGVCTVCGSACPHNAGAAEADGIYACDICGQTVTAKVVAPGGTTTYYADGYDGNNTKSGLYFAIKAAKTGSTVAALGGGNVAGGVVKGSKTLTLDVSNGKTIDGMLYVGYDDTGSKLIVCGSAEFSYVIVDPDNTLDLTGWTGKMGSLTVRNGGKAVLKSGTFAEININGAAAGSLLAPGYAFQNADTGAYVEYSSTADMKNVKVVKCSHSGVTLKEDRTGAACRYCGASFAATLDDMPYDTLDDAVSAWLTNGGTLKLYADAGDRSTVDFSSGADKPFVIDLNGFAFNKDGAAIRLSGGKSLTIMDSREKTSSAGAFGPVTADSGTLILDEGGYLQGLTVPSTSTADIKLRGGKVSALSCPVPVFNLLEDGYALMNGNITVDPTSILNSGTETYTVKNVKIDVSDMDRTAVIPFGQTTVPFPVSLTTGDDEIGRVQFKWYVVKEDGTAAELTGTGDLRPRDGVYSYDIATDGSGKAGWSELKIGKTYDVICVAIGKEKSGAYCWQTILKNFKITVKQADLADAEIKFTKPNQVTFDPFSAVTTAVPDVDFTVTCGGRTLVYGTDYTVTGNTASGVGYYTLTISGVGANYTGTKTVNWEVIEYMLSRPTQTLTATKQYDGTTDLSGSFVTSEFRSTNGNETRTITLTEGTDYTVSDAHYLTPDVGDNKEIAYTITLLNKNYVLGGGYTAWDDCDQSWPQPVSASITQAAAPAVTKPGTLTVVNGLTHTRTLDLSTLLPVLTSPMEYGKVTYQVTGVDIGAYHDASRQAAVDENGRLTIGIKAVDTKQEGPVGKVTVRVSSTNIQDFTLTINVSAENKILPTGAPKLSRTTIAYGSALSTITLSGAMTDEANGKTVSGTFTWTAPDAILAVGSHQAEWRFTPADGDTYAEADGTVSITVEKATPAGNPKYTAITSSGKKLSDAALAVNDKWPEGTVKWVDKDGKELPADTEVKANTAYTWVFTPNDTENYNTATGKLTLYSVSTGGGGGGGAAAAPSVTVPVSSAKSTVTVSASVSGSTASISISDRQIESVASDGGSVTVDVSGLKNVDSAKLPSSVIGKTEQAGAGLTVALPTGSVALDAKALESIGTGKDVTVSVQQTTLTDAQRSAVSALAQVTVVVDVNVVVGTAKQSSFDGGRLTVSIPYALKSGEDPAKLAVWFIRDDGTIENKGGSYDAKAGAFVFTTEHLSQYLLVNTDNVLTFTDVPATAYYAGAVAWAAEKGITSGTKDGRFDPNGSCTRAQIVTFLWRAAGSPEPKSAAGFADVSDSAYYAKAVAWAVENGITAGTKDGRFDPDAPCTRAQSVTFLYRAAGSPAVTGGAGFSDVAANAYYAAAVAWAVENGVTTGTKDGGFSPNATCTRAQIVTFLYRSAK